MKTTLYILALATTLLLGCSKSDSPWIDKSQITKLQHANDDMFNVAVIFNNDIYFYGGNFANPAKRITNTPAQTKTNIKISHNHKKFAYLKTGGIIEIVDSSGTVLNTLNQFSGVKQFDWSANDSTIWMLRGNDIEFYGPALNIPAIQTPLFYTSEVLSATISANNDIAYVLRLDNGVLHKLYVIPHGTDSVLDMHTEYSSDPLLYVSFGPRNADLCVCYGNYNSSKLGYSRIDFYSSLNLYRDLTFEYSSRYYSPIYRNDINRIVFFETTSTPNNTMLRVFNVDDFDKNIDVDEISSATVERMYVDWK